MSHANRREFDLELLAEKLQNDLETSELGMKELERIPLVKKVAVPADIIRGGQTQNLPVLPAKDTVCRDLSFAEKKS